MSKFVLSRLRIHSEKDDEALGTVGAEGERLLHVSSFAGAGDEDGVSCGRDVGGEGRVLRPRDE